MHTLALLPMKLWSTGTSVAIDSICACSTVQTRVTGTIIKLCDKNIPIIHFRLIFIAYTHLVNLYRMISLFSSPFSSSRKCVLFRYKYDNPGNVCADNSYYVSTGRLRCETMHNNEMLKVIGKQLYVTAADWILEQRRRKSTNTLSQRATVVRWAAEMTKYCKFKRNNPNQFFSL